MKNRIKIVQETKIAKKVQNKVLLLVKGLKKNQKLLKQSKLKK